MNEATVGERGPDELLRDLESLIAQLEEYPDAEARNKALDLVHLILRLHGEALRRVLATFETLPLKGEIYSRLLRDEVIRATLTIHDLLPEALPERVAKAIEAIRPLLISHGCDAKLLGIDGGRARLRLIRNGQGAPPVAALKLEIEKVLDVAAPDLVGIDIEGFGEQVEATADLASRLGALIAAKAGTPSASLVQIKRSRTTPAEVNGAWVSVVRSLGFSDGQFKVISYADIDVLVCKIEGEFYAYRNACPADESRSLDDASFDSPLLSCACHQNDYDLGRGGVCVGNTELRLQSLPLKVEDDKVKVAIPWNEEVADGRI